MTVNSFRGSWRFLLLLAPFVIVTHLRANSYDIVYGAFSWLEAKADAESRGGHLATITTEQEWELISTSLGFPINEQLWLGGSDAALEGSWEWVTGEIWSYSRWASGEPSSYGLYGEEDYLTVYGYLNGLWNDSQEHHLGFGNGGYVLEFETATSPVPDSGGFMTVFAVLFAALAILRCRAQQPQTATSA